MKKERNYTYTVQNEKIIRHIVVLGNSKVGKSTLLAQIVNDKSTSVKQQLSQTLVVKMVECKYYY